MQHVDTREFAVLNVSSLSDNLLLSLRDIHLIGPQKWNPNAEEAEAQMFAFADYWGVLLPTFQEYTSLCSALFPFASLEALVAAGNLCNLLLYLDDLYENTHFRDDSSAESLHTRQLFSTAIKSFATGDLPAKPQNIHHAFVDVRQQLLAIASPAWFTRLVQILASHLNHAAPAIENFKDQHGQFSLERYLEVRLHDSGALVTVGLLEPALGMTLPDSVAYHPDVQRLMVTSCVAIGFMNDLFSYEKEVIQEGAKINSLYLLMQNDSLTFRQAVDRVVRHTNRIITDFLAYEQQLPSFGPELDPLIAHYVQGLKDHLDAVWYWQSFTNRYRSESSPYEELRGLH